MSEPKTLNINAATERQIKEYLKVGISKAWLIIMKRNQQPENALLVNPSWWKWDDWKGLPNG